jgi:hypothetical protein
MQSCAKQEKKDDVDTERNVIITAALVTTGN